MMVAEALVISAAAAPQLSRRRRVEGGDIS
jgi:hypothetical protein